MQIEKNKKINIAIDGHSGCGKSSTAKAVARMLDYTYLDTGAMYRAVTLSIQKANIPFINREVLQRHLDTVKIQFEKQGNGWSVLLNGEPVEAEIRSLSVSGMVSEVSAIPEVREKLVQLQRDIAKSKGVVMDGRDIGTVVLPDAELKVFMTASAGIRARRRQIELKEKGIDEPLEDILKNLVERDEIDSNRAMSPLVQAKDSVLIDTTHISFDEQVKKVVELANEKMEKTGN